MCKEKFMNKKLFSIYLYISKNFLNFSTEFFFINSQKCYSIIRKFFRISQVILKEQ